MKKFASILLAGLMALSLFAGCSSEVTSTDDGSSAAQASSSGTESQAESNGSSEDAYAGLFRNLNAERLHFHDRRVQRTGRGFYGEI